MASPLRYVTLIGGPADGKRTRMEPEVYTRGCLVVAMLQGQRMSFGEAAGPDAPGACYDARYHRHILRTPDGEVDLWLYSGTSLHAGVQMLLSNYNPTA